MKASPSLFFHSPVKKNERVLKRAKQTVKKREIVNVQPTSSHYNYVSNLRMPCRESVLRNRQIYVCNAKSLRRERKRRGRVCDPNGYQEKGSVENSGEIRGPNRGIHHRIALYSGWRTDQRARARRDETRQRGSGTRRGGLRRWVGGHAWSGGERLDGDELDEWSGRH